jgi:hypoxanthine phosphoribosyltransferase
MKDRITVDGRKFEHWIDEKKIIARVRDMADQIKVAMAGEEPVFLCVLNGALIFTADLIRYFEGESSLTCVKLNSYTGDKRSETVSMSEKIDVAVKGRSVVILEDIIDTGFTLEKLMNAIKTIKPASVKTAALLYKKEALQCDVHPDFAGFQVPDHFYIGYGLDFNQKGRNLRSIYRLVS